MLGERIAEMRRQRGWTQAELAEKAGLRQATISKIERGQRRKNGVTTLQGIATAFNIDLTTLLKTDSTKTQ
jgi:transcriptional regulator with XRE-family HTH domain